MSAEQPPYAMAGADYGRSADPAPRGGGRVVAVAPESAADDAGIVPGMIIERVNGAPLTDMITWLWEAADEEVELEVFDPADGAREHCTLERLPGEDWGISFEGAVFDGMRTCVNACVFCFMTMLPPHMRDTLYIRDDDFRLSFLQGNFVTLTNLDDADVATVIERRLSPMNVSLHAITPAVRRQLMGKNAARGIEVLEALMAADIEIHAQIVVCPGINDGAELDLTLRWCEEHPAITSVGIVPMGYTRFQRRFTSSFSDDPEAARRVVAQVLPYQERARARTGRTIFQLSDEFYLDAELEVPPAAWYDGYPQFYDGIGMIRSYLDETEQLCASAGARIEAAARALRDADLTLAVVSGAAAAATVAGLVEAPPLDGRVITIQNDYFGGNVDVTGLICGEDLLAQLPADLGGVMLFLPEVMFNADGLTLDGYHRRRLVDELSARGARAYVSSTLPHDLIEAIEAACAAGAGAGI